MNSAKRYLLLAAAVGAAGLFAWPHAALAQKPTGVPDAYPSRPLRVIVGTAPGGGTDIITRPIMQKLSERWGVPVVVENRVSGIGSVMAMNYAVKATPDGYTLLISSASTFLNAALVLKVPYDVITTFNPVALFTRSPFVMVVPNSSPATNVKEFLEYAKSRKGAINYAISGVGSSGHLAGEWMEMAGGIEMTHVPYKGIGPAIVDLMGGRIDMLFATPNASMPHARAGKLRAIAVTSLNRAKSLPQLPAISETLPEFDVSTWFGALVPAGTPKPIIAALNRELNAILLLPDIQKALTTSGAEVVPVSPKEFGTVIASGVQKMERVIKKTAITLK